MVQDEQASVYYIPDNFIDESRILRGLFKTRNFVEGLAMALFVAIFAWLIPAGSVNVRIFVLVSVCGPFFLLGYHGFNGDPFTVSVNNAYTWLQNRAIMLYNNKNRALAKSPLDAMMEQELLQDKIVDTLDDYVETRRRRMASKLYIEGETFEFEDDAELFDIYADSKAMRGKAVWDINETDDSLMNLGGMLNGISKPAKK